MPRKQLTSDLFVSKQISINDLELAAAAGIKTIICNRPEGEEAGQLPFEAVKNKAIELGLKAVSIPVVGGAISDHDVTKFAETLLASPKPALAYCRTGTRSSILWGLSQSGKMPIDEVLAAAQAAGYDISSISTRYVEPTKTVAN